MDPAQLRLRNLVAGDPEDVLITGPLLVGVSSKLSLEMALDLAGYQRLRDEQKLAREEGRLFGIGFATFIEAAPGPENYRQAIKPVASEAARVKLEADGHLVVYAAQAPQGQSHQTTLAQVAADAFGVPFDHVRVVTGDTDSTPYKFIGTAGSLASTWASGSVILSARKVRRRCWPSPRSCWKSAPTISTSKTASSRPMGCRAKPSLWPRLHSRPSPA